MVFAKIPAIHVAAPGVRFGSETSAVGLHPSYARYLRMLDGAALQPGPSPWLSSQFLPEFARAKGATSVRHEMNTPGAFPVDYELWCRDLPKQGLVTMAIRRDGHIVPPNPLYRHTVERFDFRQAGPKHVAPFDLGSTPLDPTSVANFLTKQGLTLESGTLPRRDATELALVFPKVDGRAPVAIAYRIVGAEHDRKILPTEWSLRLAKNT